MVFAFAFCGEVVSLGISVSLFGHSGSRGRIWGFLLSPECRTSFSLPTAGRFASPSPGDHNVGSPLFREETEARRGWGTGSVSQSNGHQRQAPVEDSGALFPAEGARG